MRGRISLGSSKPEGERARGLTSQRANQPWGEKLGGEKARGRKSQGVNQPGGETAKRRKSQTPYFLLSLEQSLTVLFYTCTT